MTDLLSEVEYGRILGSFTAVAEDFGDTVAPEAIPLSGRVTFVPSKSNISYINSEGETASLYIAPVNAVISQGRIIGKDGKDGVVLLASDSNNVSASVLWTARISLDPVNSGDEAPETHDFLIEVRRGEIASLIDVIKENSRVHNIALFHDAIAEAAAKFWERVESGEFRGNQGPPGPPGVGIGVAGPAGLPGKSGKDGDPGVGGNLLPDGDLEEPGFLVTGDMQETSDAVKGNKAVTLSKATSRKIFIEPEKSYVGSVYVKSADSATVSISQRVFGAEGDIDRVIENRYDVPANTWKNLTFLLDTNVGDQSMEIITQADGRTITVDHYTLSDNSVVKGLQKDLTAAQEQLEAAMAQLDLDIAHVDSERERLAGSLNDLAVVLEDADIDLTALNQEMADLKSDLATEETKRQEADDAAQLILDQLDTNLAQAKQELVDNKLILETLDTDLATAKAELLASAQSIETLETVTLPELQKTLEAANTAAIEELTALDDKLYGAEGDITTAKASIAQLAADLTTEAQTRAQLAIDLQADFEERDTRLAEAEGILSAAFPDGAVNVPEELSRTIRDSVVQYAVSNSDEIPPTTGWSPAAPNKDPGQYIWFRTLITYGDNSTSPSSAALLTGNTGPSGPQGPAGEDGTDGTGVTIVGSRDSEAQLPTTGNAGDAYLVGGYLYVWSSGSWSNVGLIRGPQGVPGPAGADGEPRYTWVKYASSASGDDISDDPEGKSYIGLAYNKPTAVESDIPGDYQWALIQGPQGSPGIQGPAGKDGRTLYTWLKYASTPTTGMSDSPVGKDYIGLAYNKTTPTESNNYIDYQWTLIKGEKGDQGVPGAPGADGTPRYTWVKYATSSSGAGMSDDPTGKTYIGLAYNKTTASESTVASDYQWALIQGPRGEAGPQGVPGPEGADGQSLYTWIKYADTPTAGMSDLPAGKKYMGIAYNKTTATESSSYSDYEWSLIEGPQGSQGIQGPAGPNGQATYTWIKYGTSASGAGMSDSPVGKTYIGIAYNKTTATESGTASDYQWSLIQGPKGDTGGTGPQGIGISGITPYYRDVVRGAAAPAVPTTATPSGWATSEPTWVPNRDLYRVEKITYTNSTFAYTAVTKIAAYAGIDAAMAAANGKNLNTYTDLAPASKPGPAPANNSSRTVGDIHRNRNSSTGEVWAEYQWTGSAWKPVSFGDSVLTSLDVGKVTGGTGAFQKFFADKLIADDATITKLWTDQLAAKTITAQQVTVAPGNSFPDPSGMVEGTRNSVGGGGNTWSWDVAGRYWKRAAVNGGTTQFNAYLNTTTGYDSGPLTPGETYRIAYDIWGDGTGNIGQGRAAIYYRRADGSTAFVGDAAGDGDVSDRSGPLASNQWHHVERTWIAPDDAVSGGFTFQLLSTSASATEIRIRNPFIGVKSGAVSIKDGAVSADKINAESVGAAVGKFINLETSQLVATDNIKTPEAVIDKIWADGISAKSISASRLAVAPGNLFPDPYFQDVEGWSANPNTSVVVAANPAENIFKLNTHKRQTGVYLRSIDTDPWVLKPGATYIVRLEAKFTGDGGNRLGLYAQGRREDGSISTSAATFARKSVGTWDSYESTLSIPVDTTGVYRPALHTISPYSAGETIEVRKVEVLPMVGSVLIEDGAVNASKINAESVAAAVGQFVKVEAGNIVAGSADIDSLVAQKIAGATAAFQKVNADKIVASTGTMDSATINQIWADGIAAKAITTNKLTVATGNLVPDGDEMVTDRQWGGMVRSTTEKPGQTIASRTQIAGTVGRASIGNEPFTVTPGQEYSVQMWIKASKPNSKFYMELRDVTTGSHAGAGTLIEPEARGTGPYVLFQDQLVPDVWTLFRGTWVPNPGVSSVRFGTFYFNHSNGTERNADISIAGLSIKPKVGAVLIENGAISANHMTANSIDTEHLRANAVSAEKILAGAVTTDKMVANSINGDRIKANTLDAGKITSKTITATQIKAGTISATEIASRTITADKLVAGSITSNEIQARTITAAEIATGTIQAENISATTLDVLGELTVQKLSGEHIYGAIIEGGEFRTSDTEPGQIRMSDTSFRGGPGIEIEPINVSGYSRLPGVGPTEDGATLSGGLGTDGTISGVTAAHSFSSLYYNGPNFKLGESGIGAWVHVNDLSASLTHRSGVLRGLSDVSATDGARLISYSGSSIQSFVQTRGAQRISEMRAYSGTGQESGYVRAEAKQAELASVNSNNNYVGRINVNLIDASMSVAGTGQQEGRLYAANNQAFIRATKADGARSLAHVTDEFAALTNYDAGGGVTSTIRASGTTSHMRANGTDGSYGLIQADPNYSIIRAESGTGTRQVEVTSDAARLFSSTPGGQRSFVEARTDDVVLRRVRINGYIASALDIANAGASLYSVDTENFRRGLVTVSDSGVGIQAGVAGSAVEINANGVTIRSDRTGGSSNALGIMRLVNAPGTSQAANGFINPASGVFARYTSARKYKHSIEDWSPDLDAVLGLQPRSWQSRSEFDDPDQRFVGFIAEEVEDLGLTPLVIYVENEDGVKEVESLAYDRFAAAHQVVLKSHEARIKTLESTLEVLLREVETLRPTI